MKAESKDKIREGLYILVTAYESGSHTIFHAAVGDPEFERKVIQPLKEVYGWKAEDDAAIKKIKKESDGLVNSQPMGKSTGSVRMLFKLAAAAVTAGGIYCAIKKSKKDDAER